MIAWLRARLLREGPTDAVGLMRVGLALLAWTRWGMPLGFFMRPHPEMWALGAVFFVASSAMLLGWYARLSTAITGAALVSGWVYFNPVHGMEDEFDSHHTRILTAAIVLLALTPCGRSWSLDRFLAVRRANAARAPLPSADGPLWGVDLIALLVASAYFWSAFDKTQWAFLSGERLENIFVHWFFFDYPYWLPGFHAACVAMAWATVAIEYVLPFALFVPRLQRWFVPAGLLLHAVFFVVLPVSTFSCTMMLLYLAFLDPAAVRRVLATMSAPATV